MHDAHYVDHLVLELLVNLPSKWCILKGVLKQFPVK